MRKFITSAPLNLHINTIQDPYFRNVFPIKIVVFFLRFLPLTIYSYIPEGRSLRLYAYRKRASYG